MKFAELIETSVHRNTYRILGVKIRLRKRDCKKEHVNISYSAFEGIGSRVMGLISILHFSECKSMTIYWPSTGWVSAKFLELFKPIEGIDFKEVSEPCTLQVQDKIIPPTNLLLTDCDKKIVGKNTSKFLDHGIYVKYGFNEIPESVRKIFRPYFELLKPSDAVEKRIRQMDNLPRNYISVQIRNNPDWQKFGRNEDINKFFEALDSYPKDSIFYISAMQKEIFDMMSEKYKGRVVGLVDKKYDSMTDALAELYLLSQGKEMLLSYGSAFTMLGWWLGGAKANVKLVGDRSSWI